ncbi:2-C-methyl-D-erythritol 4-phosphate cytidylyltransferase [Candidatus Poribacteria bacterium]|nr:2-C-methyl-D-erythritol 4-phosphate cytidylyltransferase [Candidatus Poribacteria bacterium]
MKIAAIIASAGQSRRMGGKINKQFIKINGLPLLAHTLKAFQNSSLIDQIIIAIEANNIELCQNEIVNKFNIFKIFKIVQGGKERQDSIYNAIKVLPDDIEYVLIHDGARPMVTQEIIHRVIREVKISKAVITAVPVKDTIKEIKNDIIVSTLNRANLVSVQTPQAFEVNIIKKAYEEAYKNNFLGTDDAMLVERIGIPIKVVMGSYSNIKVTTPEDVEIVKNKVLNLELGN